MLFFWLPFYDNKFNSTRLERLRVTMATECRLVPKENQESDETTPIVSDKRSPTSSPPRQTSPTSAEATPTDTKHDAMATEHSLEEATPTNMDETPVKNEASTGLEGTGSDEDLRTRRSVPSTEPVNA